MAWKHKTLRSSSLIIGNDVFDVGGDGTLSPDPSNEALCSVKALPEFLEDVPKQEASGSFSSQTKADTGPSKPTKKAAPPKKTKKTSKRE